MTNKDLNLAFDQNLVQPASPHPDVPHDHNTHSHSTHGHNTETNKFEAPHAPRQRKQPKKNTLGSLPFLSTWLGHAKQQPFTLLSVTLFIANALFLLWAGFWLSSHNQPSSNVANTINPSIMKGVSTKFEILNKQLLSLKQQLDQIKLSIGEQQQLIATSSLDLNKDVQDLTQQVQIAIAPKAETEKPDTVKKIPTKDWHVNLGTFSTHDAALRLQKQLSALGHSVQINTTSFDNKTAYRVQLPGFKDRNSAEQVARRIMDKTNLNGLWAWKDE
jgi:cell division septation protein DedD